MSGMKKILSAFFVFTLLSAAAFAEGKLLLGKDTSVGGYGGPAVKVTTVDGQLRDFLTIVVQINLAGT